MQQITASEKEVVPITISNNLISTLHDRISSLEKSIKSIDKRKITLKFINSLNIDRGDYAIILRLSKWVIGLKNKKFIDFIIEEIFRGHNEIMEDRINLGEPYFSTAFFQNLKQLEKRITSLINKDAILKLSRGVDAKNIVLAIELMNSNKDLYTKPENFFKGTYLDMDNIKSIVEKNNKDGKITAEDINHYNSFVVKFISEVTKILTEAATKLSGLENSFLNSKIKEIEIRKSEIKKYYSLINNELIKHLT